jgi:hypothetical protein
MQDFTPINHSAIALSLRDAFALSHAGHDLPLKLLLEAQLPRSLAAMRLETGVPLN